VAWWRVETTAADRRRVAQLGLSLRVIGGERHGQSTLTTMYRLRLWSEKERQLRRLRSQWIRLQTRRSGEPFTPVEYIERFAPGRSFVDVGGMYGGNGKYSFKAEDAGASRVMLVDIDRTPEFDKQRIATGSKVEFTRFDAMSEALHDEIGTFDVVWCFGLLYHVPDPLGLLQNLRRICDQWLLLESLVIPELPGFSNMATFYPGQPQVHRQRWSTVGRGGLDCQLAISTDFDPERGTENNFWGLSPSCVRSLLQVAGFSVHSSNRIPRGPLRHAFVAQPVYPQRP